MTEHTHDAYHAAPPHTDASHEPESARALLIHSGAWLRSRTGLVLLAFLVVAGYFLVTEHRAHVSTAMPFLLIVAVLLMHVFMRHGHADHGADTGQTQHQTGEPQ